MLETVTSRPQPDVSVYSHSVTGCAAKPPAPHFTDSLRDIERLAAGDTSGIPMVNVWENEEGWETEVTLWSVNSNPTVNEIAALEGTLAGVIASSKS
ncbi:MAG: hypothetical protein JW384_01233 [Nitrosomonadaceae bacterium]|nr:hypothetical protein [Nitrosomonadaceae bacterium]